MNESEINQFEQWRRRVRIAVAEQAQREFWAALDERRATRAITPYLPARVVPSNGLKVPC